ncbi:MAG TPA: hypothetical protein VH500_02440 [Nitrososphaeraceae archaeon]|jgi:hypothetical protein
MIKAPNKAPHYNNEDRDNHQDKDYDSYILSASTMMFDMSQFEQLISKQD